MRSRNLDLYTPRRKRRGKKLAVIVGGVIAAVVIKWLGFGASAPSAAPAQSSQAPNDKTVITIPLPPQDRSTRPAEMPTDASNPSKVKFDFYTLALSMAPAFCEQEPKRKQCKLLNNSNFNSTPLTLHGLWPEYAKPGRYPSECNDSKLRLADIDSERLRRFMPGVVDGLASHEWRKHGTCSGLSTQTYFAQAIDQTEKINAALGSVFQLAAGKTIESAAIRKQADVMLPGLGQALTLHCRNLAGVAPALRQTPILVELRVCYKTNQDGSLGTFAECAAFDRIDQGCGQRFGIDTP